MPGVTPWLQKNVMHGVLNHRYIDRLFKSSFQQRGHQICASPAICVESTSEWWVPSQNASNTDNVSMPCRHYDKHDGYSLDEVQINEFVFKQNTYWSFSQRYFIPCETISSKHVRIKRVLHVTSNALQWCRCWNINSELLRYHRRRHLFRLCFTTENNEIKLLRLYPHYNDVIISEVASQFTSLAIVYSTVYSRRRSKKTSKLRATCLCAGNSPVTGEFPTQRASNAENVSILWRHHSPLINNNAGNDLLYDCTKPLPEPTFTDNQTCIEILI